MDALFMEEALKEAEKAFEEGEVPVGALLVEEETIIARAHNRTEQLQTVTAHAEMLCLQAGAAHRKNWRLPEMTLYTTLEPCPMCAGALLLSRVKRVVWAANDPRQGAGGSFCSLLLGPYPFHTLKTDSGIFAERSAALLQAFFRKRRGC